MELFRVESSFWCALEMSPAFSFTESLPGADDRSMIHSSSSLLDFVFFFFFSSAPNSELEAGRGPGFI